MSRDDAVKLFSRQQAAWNARDSNALADDYSDDGTIISPIFRTVQGREAIIESFRSLFATFPDWQFIGQELLVDGDTIAEPFIVNATHVRDFMGLPGVGPQGRDPGRVCLQAEGRPDYLRASLLRFHRPAHSAGGPSR